MAYVYQSYRVWRKVPESDGLGVLPELSSFLFFFFFFLSSVLLLLLLLFVFMRFILVQFSSK